MGQTLLDFLYYLQRPQPKILNGQILELKEPIDLLTSFIGLLLASLRIKKGETSLTLRLAH